MSPEGAWQIPEIESSQEGWASVEFYGAYVVAVSGWLLGERTVP